MPAIYFDLDVSGYGLEMAEETIIRSLKSDPRAVPIVLSLTIHALQTGHRAGVHCQPTKRATPGPINHRLLFGRCQRQSSVCF